jgi:hypothetical protein
MRLACTALSVALVGTMCGCDSAPGGIGRPECLRLREHLVELRTVASGDGSLYASREALRSSLGDGFLVRCEQSVTRAQWDCAMAARATDQLSTCNDDR